MKTTLKQIGIILLFSGVVSFLANSVHPRKIPWVQDWSQHVESKAAQQKIKVIPLSVALDTFNSNEVTFIDARPKKEFDLGHIPGALSVPFQSVDELFMVLGELIDSGTELVVYCKNRECDDSLMLATEFQSMGASNLVLYIDGFDLWVTYGGATSSPPSHSKDAISPERRLIE
jgi:rhodanese-related sulfurtransferase